MSSWGAPEWRFLEQECGVRTVDLDQCTVGADAKKPTRLRYVNFSEIEAEVRGLDNGGAVLPPAWLPQRPGGTE